MAFNIVKILCASLAIALSGTFVSADIRTPAPPRDPNAPSAQEQEMIDRGVSPRELQEVAREQLRSCYQTRASSQTLHLPNQAGDGQQCAADCYSGSWSSQWRGHTNTDYNRLCYRCAEHFCAAQTQAFDRAYNRHGQQIVRRTIRSADRVAVQPILQRITPPAPSPCEGDRQRGNRSKACCTYDWQSEIHAAGIVPPATCSKANDWRHIYRASCNSSDHSRAAARTRRTSRALVCRCIYQNRNEFLPPDEERRLLINNGGGSLPDNELCSKYIRLGARAQEAPRNRAITPTSHSGAGPAAAAE